MAPGDAYNEATLAYLEEIVGAGAFLEGAADQSLGTPRVVAD